MPDRRPPRGWGLAVLLLVALALPALAFDEAQYELAAKTILCDCGCHPQSTYDCACGRAAEMRDEIRAMVAGGMTGEQVIARYVATHGEQIRIAPTAEGFNLVAWVGPFVGLLAAALLVGFALRRWKAGRDDLTQAASAAGPSPTEDDPYVRRLHQQLKELE